jgi:hypothetical protein
MRWRKYLMNLTRSRYRAMRRYYLNHLWDGWHVRHESRDRLREMRLWYVRPSKRELLWRHGSTPP